jgi:hypothetical protein
LTPLPAHLPAPYRVHDRGTDQYWVLSTPGLQRHQYLRQLFALSRQMSKELFRQSVARALKYRITNLATLERIAVFALQSGSGCWMGVAVDDQLRQRPAYQEGALTDSPDLSGYEPEPPPEHE